MIALNAWGALATMVELLALPGAFMAAWGAFLWYTGSQYLEENRVRTGRLLVMFGLILLIIVAILSNFLSALPPA